VYHSSSNGNRTVMPLDVARASASFSRVPEIEGPFSLKDITRAVLKRLWVVLLVTFILVGVAVGVSLWQKPTYEATAQLLVGQKQDKQEINLAGSVEGLQQLTLTMIHAIDTRPVAEEAIRRLGLQMTPDELLANLTIEQVESTTFIQLTYKGADPQEAKQIANTMGEVSSERIAKTSAAANNITATVYEEAITPDTPVAPDPLRNAILAAGLGLMLGVGLALLLEHLDDSWRSPEELEQVLGVSTFATIPEFRLAKTKGKRGR
jgi:capsular polysaccharide biosynthesis protein